MRTVRRWAAGVLLLTLAIIGAAVFTLLQIAPGQRATLDFVLDRIQGSLAGELRVGAVRSSTLLAGATLEDVVLTDETGRPAVSADSIVVRYLPTGLISGTPRLRSVIFWGLDFEISRLTESGSVNLGRLLAPRDPRPDSLQTRMDVFFGQVGVREGRVSVLSPATGAGVPGVVPGPEGPLQRLGLDAMNLDLEDAVLRIDQDVTFASDLASLAAKISLPRAEEPLVLSEAFGRLAFDLEDGLRVTEGAFRLPETLGRGAITLGPSDAGEGWAFGANFAVSDWGELADLRWADPRIPDGRFRGAVTVSTEDGVDLSLSGIEIQLEASNLAMDGGVTFGETLTTRNLTMTASPVVLSRLEPWIGSTLPLPGWLSGRATFSGPVENLSASGRVTLVPTGFGGHPTTADFDGRVHLGDDPGWTDFEARLDPLNYTLIQALAPDISFDGQGSANVQLDGRTRRGLRLVTDFTHERPGATVSHASVRGMLNHVDGVWSLDLSGDVAPLSLAALTGLTPELGLRGEVRGPLTARGPLDALELTGELEGADGRLRFDGVVDVLDPASGYRLDLEAEELRVASFSSRVPDPTAWNGTVSLEGSGFVLDSLEGRASLQLFGSNVGALTIDTIAAGLRAEAGMLYTDSLLGSVAGVRFQGTGELGMRPDRDGGATLRFSTESLVGLRPLFMGDSLLVGDELTSLEREMLRLEGIEPDTLPTAEDVRMTGAVDGVAELSGRLSDLFVDVRMTIVDGAYGPDQVDSLDLRVSVAGLPSLRGRWETDVTAVNLIWGGRSFEAATLSGTMVDRTGEGALQLVRTTNESYTVAGDFMLDSLGGAVNLVEASATLDEQMWRLVGPTALAWSSGTLTVEGLEVEREGEDPMRLVAGGTLSRQNDSDFRLDVEGLHLERVAAMVRSEPLELEGHVDLALHVRGPAGNPLIDAELEVLDGQFRNIVLTRIAGTMVYRDRESTLSLEAWDGTRQALTASGTIPIDLTLADVETRRLDAPMDLTIAVDSLDAGLALAYFSTLADVDGVISADLHVGGLTSDPEPTGSARLTGGAWTIEALGVRHQNVSGTLELRSDQTMTVDLATRGTGTSTVTGSIGLSPLSDPSLDLVVSFDRFRAMNRRDLEGTLSGRFALTGTYQRPLAEGEVTVDEGTLLVDEFSRAAGVIDLADPRLFGQGLAVDTTVFMSQPILAEVRNPFFDNLRMNVQLSVPRNTWLRSNVMNVEMGGDLLVRYDRNAGDLVLIGELQALRGTYVVLGRTFEVIEGTVSFIGRPGVNPSLNIVATSRIRPREGDAVVITTTVEGTLVRPTVTLTSEGGELSESDLISYLVFNRAAGELGRNQQALVSSSAIALVNWAGASLAQNVGLDYLSLSSGPGSVEGLGEQLRTTQLEVGRYLSDDVFLVVVLRPPGEGGANTIGGIRIEWALTNSYNLEAFVEDRFLRSGAGLLGVQELGGEQLYGVLLLREWGYN
ncbi:MAG: translocation/assembly module TamB domain-containing protein [Gemmatimonadota bacterium]